MKHKNHLWRGNYYHDVYKKSISFIAGYRSRKYFDGDDYALAVWPIFWEVECKTCARKLLNTKKNKQEIKDTLNSIEGSIATLVWGKNFTPETWPLYNNF